MKAFWWLEENILAGMARPGFNGAHWFDLPLDQALLFGWLGVRTSGAAPLAELRAHVTAHSQKIARFYGHNDQERRAIVNGFNTQAGVEAITSALTARTQLLDSFTTTQDQFYFEFSTERLRREIALLKEKGVKRIVALTESHHDKDQLQEHFELHHFSIEDLTAPSFDQAEEMADIIQRAKADNQPLVIHCMAGIGRTSTMIIAAYMVLGEPLNDLLEKVAAANPTYQLAGNQAAFIQSVHDRMTEKRSL